MESFDHCFRARVLVAKDEEFTPNLLSEVLTAENFQVQGVLTSHASSASAVRNGMALTAGVIYVVKSNLGSKSGLI